MNETERLEQLSNIYSTQMGRLSKRLISHYTWEFIEPMIRRQSILLMGLGDGHIANKLCERTERLTVVEGAKAIIEKFSASVNGCRIIHSLFEEFRPDKQFDVIIGTHILEHIENPIEILKLTRTWLKSDGKAVFTVPNSDSLHRHIGVELGLLETTAELNELDLAIGHRRVYDVASLQRDLKVAGYVVEKIRGYLIKVLSNRQMKDWDRTLLDALYKVSLKLPAKICASLAVVCKSAESTI